MPLSNFSTISEGDDYSVTVLTTDGFNTATVESGIFCVSSNVSICGLNLLDTNQTIAIFEFMITNTLNNTQEDINWTLDTGDANITSTINFNLTAYEDIFVYFENIYNLSGTYAVNVTVESGIFKDEESINITI